MKKKSATPKKRQRLSKIAKAKTLREKFLLAHFNMTGAEWMAPEMRLARRFFETRNINQDELISRAKMEGKTLSLRTETEIRELKSLQKELANYTWTAMRLWRPDAIEKLAQAMRQVQRHTFPNSVDKWRYGAMVACGGDVEKAYEAICWNEKSDPRDVKRALYRIKKILYPSDT